MSLRKTDYTYLKITGWGWPYQGQPTIHDEETGLARECTS